MHTNGMLSHHITSVCAKLLLCIYITSVLLSMSHTMSNHLHIITVEVRRVDMFLISGENGEHIIPILVPPTMVPGLYICVQIHLLHRTSTLIYRLHV